MSLHTSEREGPEGRSSKNLRKRRTALPITTSGGAEDWGVLQERSWAIFFAPPEMISCSHTKVFKIEMKVDNISFPMDSGSWMHRKLSKLMT